MCISNKSIEKRAFGDSTDISPEDFLAIQTLVARYFGYADRSGSVVVSELFAEAGVLSLGAALREGRQAIAAFFANRESANNQARRITRHISGPLELQRLDDARISGRSTVLVYAGSGEIPLAANVPSTICDFDDIYVRVDNRWLFERRQATALFLGPGAASFAK